MTRLATVFAVALLLAPPALAGKVNPAGSQDTEGALAGDVRYVASQAGVNTMLLARSAKDGSVLRTLKLRGDWGITRIGAEGSVSFDGSTLVLAPTAIGSPTAFAVVDTRTLRVRRTVKLAGTYAYDALSPDGSLLYVIKYSGQDLRRYVVRAVNLGSGRLLPGRIADPTQTSWIMQGYPSTRISAVDGRWVYTLYANPTGYAFVHALDTVGRTARCVGIPWRGDPTQQWGMQLALRGDGTLAVNWESGAPYIAIDLNTWKIDYLS